MNQPTNPTPLEAFKDEVSAAINIPVEHLKDDDGNDLYFKEDKQIRDEKIVDTITEAAQTYAHAARVDELQRAVDMVVRYDTSRIGSNEWYKLNPRDVAKYQADRLAQLRNPQPLKENQ